MDEEEPTSVYIGTYGTYTRGWSKHHPAGGMHKLELRACPVRLAEYFLVWSLRKHETNTMAIHKQPQISM